MFILKWTNKYSGETGYVESVSSKDNCFYNTFDISKAKRYKAKANASRILTTLKLMGEAENNDFEIVKVDE